MNKLYMAILTATLLTFTASVSAVNAVETKPTTVESKSAAVDLPLTEKYTNPEKNYSIDYPQNWKKNDVPRLDLVLFAPSKNGSTSHASMNVVSEKVGPSVTLDQFYSESASNLTTALKDVQVEKTGTTDLNGVTSKWLLYTHVMQDIKFRVLQYFIVSQDIVYLLTFSAVADTFDSYQPEFEAIAKSFKIQKLIAPAGK